MKNPLGISVGLKNYPLLPEYAAAGFEVVEISMPDLPLDALRDFGFAALKLLKDSGMTLWTVHLPFGRELDISEPDETKRLAAVDSLGKVIDLARELGAQALVVHGSSEPNPDAERAVRMAACAESLKALQAKAGSMKLAVENLPRTCIGRTGVEIAELSGSCAGVCFDVNHLLIESHEVFMKNAAPHVITTHLSDYDGIDERHWLPGMGVVPWKQVHDTLLSVGYEGPFLFELGCDKDGEPYKPSLVVNEWKRVIA